MATLLFSLLLLSAFHGVRSAIFTMTNNCAYTVYPAILSSAGIAPLGTTGFRLLPSETRGIDAPPSWSGRMWGRTFCSDATSAKFSCLTGDCGSGLAECQGGGPSLPVTLVEFTLNGGGNNDFYDVSLVDGYNIPIVVFPQNQSGSNCLPTGCITDLNGLCPNDLRVVSGSQTVACKSACEAFQDPRYCCSGAYSNPNTCGPTSYSQYFKNACPRAYSYAYDDATSTFTCTSGLTAYLIMFCPNNSSLKSGGSNPQAAGVPPMINGTMIYSGDSIHRAQNSKLILISLSISVISSIFL
ncbi:hypothetical protein LUZ60_007125 [Juncus effusus]|nr:hypothetical protein LUZ60_007125 [Juncus effusus]